jgi:polar amino acid transport system ATP-binding protein
MNLQLQNVDKSFGTHHVLENISLSLEKTQSLVFIGPSGGGKSTLLRVLAGLLAPEAGSVCVDGEPLVFEEAKLRAYRRTIGVVFQAYNLFPHLTALENILLPLEKVHGLAPAEAKEAAIHALRRFQLEAHAGKKPAALSGGQQQRVAIARAIASKPRLLLFDEPTSALDPEMTAEVLAVIEELKQEGRDFVLVTHEMGFARHVADHVAFLAAGRIVESAPGAEIFAAPQAAQTRDFLAKILRY